MKIIAFVVVHQGDGDMLSQLHGYHYTEGKGTNDSNHGDSGDIYSSETGRIAGGCGLYTRAAALTTVPGTSGV